MPLPDGIAGLVHGVPAWFSRLLNASRAQVPAGTNVYAQNVDVVDRAGRLLGIADATVQGEVDIQVAGTDPSDANPIPVKDTWEIILVSDEPGNDNDKTLTVPAGYEYQILWIWIELTTDANAGNRQLQIDLRDTADDVIGQIRPGAVQAASLTRYYMFAPALADLTAFRDTDYLMTPLPPTVFLPAGFDLRVFDNNNISAVDDMVIQMQVARRAA